MNWVFRSLVIFTLICLTCSFPVLAQEQIEIDRVKLMPDSPEPYKMKDWRALAVRFDRFVFDETLSGEYLPLMWWDDSARNRAGRTFALPSYVGFDKKGEHHEAITGLAAVLSATLVGIDKRVPQDFVEMAKNYYNSADGTNLVLNGTHAGTGNSFWYELWPHFLFYGLVDRYPKTPEFDQIMRATADRWHDACVALGCDDGKANFDFTAFNFRTMRGVNNGKWIEPDAAAAIAWIEYVAWTKFGDEKYLQAADWCMTYLQQRAKNPLYEILCPLGAYTAARMNAELGRDYDTTKMLNWNFTPDSIRYGWGVIAQRWGDYDCYGLAGSTTDRGGYAFAMNTFALGGVLAPLVRYDDRYAHTIGKWMLNSANAARLFYADELPADHQSCPDWKGDPEHVVAYEGLRKEWQGKSPVAIGDPTTHWHMPLDFGVYGSSYVGFYGAMIATTDVPKILELDLTATEFFKAPCYPTHLYYNPYNETKTIHIDIGASPRNGYDTVSKQFLFRAARGQTAIDLAPRGIAVVVLTPPGGAETRKGSRLLVNGIVVDYRRAEPRD